MTEQLFACLFPDELRNYLKEQDAVFILLSCGATVTREPSFEAVLQLATR